MNILMTRHCRYVWFSESNNRWHHALNPNRYYETRTGAAEAFYTEAKELVGVAEHEKYLAKNNPAPETLNACDLVSAFTPTGDVLSPVDPK